MNSNMILEFLENYKYLDELCRQILSSERGISEYIDKMSNVRQGYRVAGWDKDYKKLKKMRWIRNRLVHETDSFEDNLVNEEDSEWLHTFYCRIMECTDPFSLLHQSENMNRKPSKHERYSENDFPENQASLSRNRDWSYMDIVLAGLILTGVILLGIVIFGSIFYFL